MRKMRKGFWPFAPSLSASWQLHQISQLKLLFSSQLLLGPLPGNSWLGDRATGGSNRYPELWWSTCCMILVPGFVVGHGDSGGTCLGKETSDVDPLGRGHIDRASLQSLGVATNFTKLRMLFSLQLLLEPLPWNSWSGDRATGGSTYTQNCGGLLVAWHWYPGLGLVMVVEVVLVWVRKPLMSILLAGSHWSRISAVFMIVIPASVERGIVVLVTVCMALVIVPQWIVIKTTFLPKTWPQPAHWSPHVVDKIGCGHKSTLSLAFYGCFYEMIEILWRNL